MDRPMGMLRGVVRGAGAPKSLKKGTIPRIWAFARPYRGWLGVYLLFTVVSATVGVLTPVLAGQVVDAIVAGGEAAAAAAPLVGQAAGIAALAIVEAVVGLVSRWFSSRIGEGLIVDLRRAVFEHVQRMPVAFFTRTRTGELVSRLNNDVIGAQRAFSDILSGVVSNVVTLVLALAVMLSISWQITVLALVLLPVFVDQAVVPAQSGRQRAQQVERNGMRCRDQGPHRSFAQDEHAGRLVRHDERRGRALVDQRQLAHGLASPQDHDRRARR
jgi:ABC-type multidrug transport system fused ATPase/permease subunit